MEFLALADQCASFVSPHTLEAIVKTESNFDPLQIGVNGGAKLQRQPVNVDEAVVTAEWLLANGYNIDLGLGQVNSANLNRVGLSVTDAFDPCKNLKAAGTIFNKSYQVAMKQYPEDQALQVALSAYNTGNFVQGFRNGYVNKVLRNMPDKVQTQTAETSTGVQPIPLLNATHKPTIAEVIRPKPATDKPALVTVEKPNKPAEAPPAVISANVYQTASNDNVDHTLTEVKQGNSDKPNQPKQPPTNVYQETAQNIMVYTQ